MKLDLQNTKNFLTFLSTLNDLYAQNYRDIMLFRLMYGEIYKIYEVDNLDSQIPKITITLHGFTSTKVVGGEEIITIYPEYNALWLGYKNVLDKYNIKFKDNPKMFAVIEGFDSKVRNRINELFNKKLKELRR